MQGSFTPKSSAITFKSVVGTEGQLLTLWSNTALMSSFEESINKRCFAWLMLDLMRKLWIIFKGQLFCQNDTSYTIDTNTAEDPRESSREKEW